MIADGRSYMKAQIQNTLRLKETDELLEIWRQADHEEWTDLAFEVVREILLERLGEIPAQAPQEQNPEAAETDLKNAEQAQAPTSQEIRKFLRQQTYESMDEMDTEVLIEIWQKHDREEWTDLAFDVVQQILLERIGEVPAREPEEQEPQPAVIASTPLVSLEPKTAWNEPHTFSAGFSLIDLHCPDCGKAISEQDRLCPHCGADLEAPLDESQLQTLAAEYLEKAQESYDLGRDFKSALKDCDQALEFIPDSAGAHNLRGLILDALGKTGLAVQEYKEAVRLDPGMADARNNLADAEAELSSRKA